MVSARTGGAALPGTSRGPYRNGLRRRQQIVETAVKVFGQYGYAGGSLRRIAELVGVSAPALIRLFGSKEALFTAVLEQSDRANSARTLEKGHGLGALRQFASAVTTNVHNRGMVELLLTVATEASNADHPARPFIVERYRNLVRILAAELRHAGEIGEIRVMTDDELDAEARGLAALMDGLELQWLLDPSIDLVAVYGYHFEQLVARWKQGVSVSERAGAS
jgi:AcrR family transcriptional regulator